MEFEKNEKKIGEIKEMEIDEIDKEIWDMSEKKKKMKIWKIEGGERENCKIYKKEGGWMNIEKEEMVEDEIKEKEKGLKG